MKKPEKPDAANPASRLSCILDGTDVRSLIWSAMPNSNTDLGDFGFTDTRRDLLKCVVVSIVTAGVGVGLFQLAHNGRVFLGLIPVFYLALKLSWLDFSATDVMVTGGTTILSIAVFSMIAFRLLAL
jgi:hypothetical protein